MKKILFLSLIIVLISIVFSPRNGEESGFKNEQEQLENIFEHDLAQGIESLIEEVVKISGSIIEALRQVADKIRTNGSSTTI